MYIVLHQRLINFFFPESRINEKKIYRRALESLRKIRFLYFSEQQAQFFPLHESLFSFPSIFVSPDQTVITVKTMIDRPNFSILFTRDH